MIDYVFKFLNEAAAKTAARAVDIDVSGTWAQDHVLPNVTVTRISTGTTIAGWFCIVATNNRVAVIEAAAALQIACDRDKANAGQPFILINNVGAILSDLTISPIFAGSNYPIGGFN